MSRDGLGRLLLRGVRRPVPVRRWPVRVLERRSLARRQAPILHVLIPLLVGARRPERRPLLLPAACQAILDRRRPVPVLVHLRVGLRWPANRLRRRPVPIQA